MEKNKLHKIFMHFLIVISVFLLLAVIYIMHVGLLRNKKTIDVLSKNSIAVFSIPVNQAILIMLFTSVLLLIIIIYIIKNNMKNDKMIFDLAFTDSLTKLFNLNKFSLDCENILKNNKNSTFAIIYFDIDNFKILNETFGHAFGDSVLIHIAKVLNDLLSPNHTFARLFNDHFAILYKYNEGGQEIIDLVNNINYKINSIMVDSQLTLNLIPSFGIYLIKKEDNDINKIINNANIAKSSIKGLHNIIYKFFDEKTRNVILETIQLENDIKVAIAKNQFEVYYQPKYSLDSNKLVGAEALIRWNHPKKGYISPGVFIPISEKDGLIIEIGRLIFRKVCSDMNEWKKHNLSLVPISINLSRAEMYQPNLIKFIKDTLDEFNIDIHLLEIELTETAALSNLEYTYKLLEKFRDLGFKISMDDFGTGYSSLSCLKSMPIDTLKLDMEFIKDIEVDTKSRNIVSSIISLAKSLNLTVIAEGLETKAQVDFLKNLGCDIAQGFYFCKPIPQKKFENLLK